MVFSSVLFLFRFVPAAFAIYYILPRRYKNAALFVLSLVFYSWGEVRFFPIMLASAIVDYVAGRGIERQRRNDRSVKGYLALSLCFNLGSLLFFKYTNFFIGNLNWLFGLNLPTLAITLPLGISFYTFQTMSYTLDVYRGGVKAERNFVDFATYVTLFPQLIAGPIVKYTDVALELKERKLSLAQIQSGVGVFIMGLGSKVLIADNMGSLWAAVEELGFGNISTPLAWLGIAAFGLQIYFDFSGYSLMAIGLGRMLGFNFPQNFNYPYISRSVTEFWRRWHMTLGSWFREYVYIPLGGNRVSKARQYFNILIVWFLTGFWHGANWNFVIWGLYFCAFLCVEKAFLLKRLESSRIRSRIYLLFFVLVSWPVFAITDFAQLGVYFTRLFVPRGGDDWLYYLRNYGVSLVFAVIFATPLLKRIGQALHPAVTTVFQIFVLLFCTAYLVDSTNNFFLYFRF